jgi:hypothetical protein
MSGAVSYRWRQRLRAELRSRLALAAEQPSGDVCTGPKPDAGHGVPAFMLTAYDEVGEPREIERWGCGEVFIDGRELPASVYLVIDRQRDQDARVRFEYNTGSQT